MPNPLADDLDFILSHTSDVWQELHGQNIFITGGTGFFGGWLLESLCWANDHLDAQIQSTVLSRRPEVFARRHPNTANHPCVSWIKGDVKDFTFPKSEFQYVIHAASEGDLQEVEKTPLVQFDTIVNGTRHVLDFAASNGTRKLLFTSSGAVYGKQPPGLMYIPEDYMGAPDTMLQRSAYGEAKRTAELMCQLFAHQYGFEVKIARCFAFVGPYLPLDTNFAIGNFIKDVMHGGPILIKGDGTPLRSYLYAADLMIWLWTILMKGQSGHPYNVGSMQPISILQLAELIEKLSGEKQEILMNGKPTPGLIPERYIPSNDRAQFELGLAGYTTLENAIIKTMAWEKNKLLEKS
jgi:nucleoside-diphosphate-sugar epimerase